MADNSESNDKPLVTLGSGSPATLDYQLPQKTAFSLFGRIPVRIDPAWFRAECRQSPDGNWWERAGALDSARKVFNQRSHNLSISRSQNFQLAEL